MPVVNASLDLIKIKYFHDVKILLTAQGTQACFSCQILYENDYSDNHI